MKDVRIGVGITGAFGAFSEILPALRRLAAQNSVTAVLSEAAATWDTRFYKAEDFRREVTLATGKSPIATIVEAEQIGPRGLFDVLLLAPCTANTLAKICHGITDTSVTMAAKSHMLNGRPLVLAVVASDALGAAAANIGGLLSRRNVYFVPYSQDDFERKPRSMTAHFGLCDRTVEFALRGEQIQPILLGGGA